MDEEKLVERFNAQMESLEKISSKLFIIGHNSAVSRSDMVTIANDKVLEVAMESHFKEYPVNSYTQVPSHVNLAVTQESLIIAAIKLTRNVIRDGMGAVDKTVKYVNKEFSDACKTMLNDNINVIGHKNVHANMLALEKLGGYDPSAQDAKYEAFIAKEFRRLDVYFDTSKFKLFLDVMADYYYVLMDVEKYLNRFGKFDNIAMAEEYASFIKNKKSSISSKLLYDVFEISSNEQSNVIGELLLELARMKSVELKTTYSVNQLLTDHFDWTLYRDYRALFFKIAATFARVTKSLSKVYDDLQVKIKTATINKESDDLIELSKSLLDISFILRNGSVLLLTVEATLKKRGMLFDRYLKEKLVTYKDKVQYSNNREQINLLMRSVNELKK